ncbi:MAG TPA: SRPBCC family protein [Ottowia sp.]|uniref:SRPBCC family protein n=1 Tax=Ottowia sp. TaxID=1898956 RepID=UPI002C5D2419|nr:SRPBCC family protein [Ottowia sp.]HMN20258.1 SRPBCC family protein [Ottowia sp.]
MQEDPNPWGTIRTLPEGGCEGTLQRTYEGHGRAELWRMLTEPVEFAKWIAPGTIELRPGGAVRIDFQDSGTAIASTVLALEPERLLSYSWSSAGEPERPLRWQLDEVPGGTRLTLTVRTPAGEDAAKACAGFEGHLDMLAGALEGVPIKFPFQRFLDARAAYNQQLGK